MEFTTEDQLGAKIAEMLEAHRGKVDIDLHIDTRFERLCSVVAGVIDSLKVAELPTEDGGQYLLQHRHEPPATWLVSAYFYPTLEGVEAHAGYHLLSVSVIKLRLKECQLRLILKDDTPSVVNYFTRLTYSIWKMFQKAELRDIIAANRPYLGDSFTGARDPEGESQTIETRKVGAWQIEGWYLNLTADDRNRYDLLRPYKESWEAGDTTDEQLAQKAGKTKDTVRGWRRKLRKLNVPDMDWQKKRV